MNALPQRPVTILIAALGGEGGGVLADWIIAAAASQDYPVQSTSIPGVAQRTGATTYYIELYPAHTAELGDRRPVMTLTPAQSYVDVMVSSELLETGRAMLNGFVTPDCTTLIASTHRIYTVAEKMHMGDGRFDSERILKAAQTMARRAILFDMQALAARSGTIINAVLFGALAGSGVLPLPRAACEDVIRKGGRGAEASLKGFALGYAHACGEAQPADPEELKRWRALPSERVRKTFPGETHEILEEGVARLADFQDRDYATLYLDRLAPIAKLEREQGGGAAVERIGQANAQGYELTSETGRFLALWMSYEDLIRVADLKSRSSRFERVRAEVQAKPHEPVHIIEYLKPGIEEAAALLPPFLSKRLLAWTAKRGLTHKLNVGIYLKSTSAMGFLLLRLMAALRPLRRMSARYAEEQALIERWLQAVRDAAARDLGLALEIALCARLIKGYGDTNRRAKASFLRILDTLVVGDALPDDRARAPLADRARAPLDDRARAVAIGKAREAALADPEGRGLENLLATQGIAPMPPQLKPIWFMRRPAPKRKAA
jgi:indolepyruvate ferredoxin oxidoreductase beta subunit